MELFEVGGDVLKACLKTYGRTPEKFSEDVTTLKEWMKTQPHLPEILGEKHIENFLLINKCSVERAKQKIDMYYTIRSSIPDIFENINPKLPTIQETMDIVYFVPLPRLTEENYRVVVNRMRDLDMVDKKEPIATLRCALNLQELRLKEDCFCGDIIILDLDGHSMKFLTKVTPSILKKAFLIYEKVYGTRMKGLYIVNSKSWVYNILALVKSLLKPKLFARIYICEDTSILRERFPKEILPRDYGGDERSLEELQEILKEKFRKYEDRFDQMDKLRVDESLRPEKLNNDDVLGFYGNFTKLDVD